jgi:flagellar protein FliJ
MKKLQFRLQKVMEYRQMAEGWAKDAFLETQARRLAGETVLEGVRDKRKSLLNLKADDLQARLSLQAALDKSDDDERAQLTVLEVLAAEEARALEEWHIAKQDLEIIEKLHERAIDDWEYELTRTEQAELDEWSVTRRRAA